MMKEIVLYTNFNLPEKLNAAMSVVERLADAGVLSVFQFNGFILYTALASGKASIFSLFIQLFQVTIPPKSSALAAAVKSSQ